MELINTPLKGLYILQTINHQDIRGGFQKLFNFDVFWKNCLAVEFKEIYYSVNKKGVLRGMHFQNPPHDHEKLVYVSNGSILDVVLDIRKNSESYGKYFTIHLDAKSGKYVYIPKGFAHGFLSLEDDTIVNYAQTSCYNIEYDCGVDAMSFGMDWRVKEPIRSGRDLTFPSFEVFKSEF